jgi:hypothetical protein
MALFGGPREAGAFSFPHSLDDPRNLILGALPKRVDAKELVARSPGDGDSIYFSKISAYRVVLTAGNSTRDLWKFIVDLTPAGSVVQGYAYFDRRSFQKWQGNALFIFDVADVLSEASMKMGRWKWL